MMVAIASAKLSLDGLAQGLPLNAQPPVATNSSREESSVMTGTLRATMGARALAKKRQAGFAR